MYLLMWKNNVMGGAYVVLKEVPIMNLYKTKYNHRALINNLSKLCDYLFYVIQFVYGKVNHW